MTSPRCIAALELLKRLKQLELEQAGEKLITIRSEQSQIEDEKRLLRERAATEAQIISNETLPFVASFVASLEARQEQLSTRLTALNRDAAGLEEALIDAFVEAKTQDTVLQQASHSLKQQQALAEEAEANEIAQAVYRRSSAR